MDNTLAYKESVIEKIELLSTYGRLYRKKIYKLTDILKIYIDQIKLQFANLGDKYIADTIFNIYTIFINATKYSAYDLLEFVNFVIVYGYKMIAFKYTKNHSPPKIPDYTIAEINDLAKNSLCV